jgi:predicted glycosyltransferase
VSNINLSIPNIQHQKIFFCVLNWGIGHATRSIPIIDFLLKNENEIILFSDGEAKKVLSLRFPNLTIIELPSYNITYQKTSFFIFQFELLLMFN